MRIRRRDVPIDEVDCADWFIHWHRFRNGDTFIDRFVKANPGLSELERRLLEWWKEPVGHAGPSRCRVTGEERLRV
ncbi:MAG: hypothetical protein AB1503_12610 [Bacillota bacterium]|nr:hypothetical protein [Bacillota bacterium]